MTFRTRIFEVGAYRIDCDEVGSGDRPLILLHGLTGHRRDFEFVIPVLGQRGWTLAPDLRGHGGSHASHGGSGYTFDELVGVFRDLLDALDVERCDLLGHSFGGMVALRFALAHPERVASLILMSTSCEAPDNLHRDVFINTGRFIREHGMAALQTRLEEIGRKHEEMLPKDATDDMRDWRRRYWDHHRMRHLAMDPLAYEALGLAMMDQVPVTDRLCEITCPCTVIAGSEDADFIRGARLLAQGLADVSMCELAAVDHHPHQEARERFLSIVGEHLDRVRS